jgi:hypothetical protein
VKESIEDTGLDTVIFTSQPITMFVKQNDVNNYLSYAPYDDFNVKLNDFLSYSNDYMYILEIRKSLWMANNFILTALFSVNYKNIEVLSVILSILVNILLLTSVQYTPQGISEPHFLIHGLNLIHLLILTIFILNWLIFNITKSLAYKHEYKGFFNKFIMIYNLLTHKDIIAIVWNFVFSLLPIIHSKLYFLYALQIFPIFKIVPTMGSVIYSVQIRYKQFLSTAFMLMILILFYASLAFYFFRGELEKTTEDGVNEKICQGLLQCFLYLFNYGIRSGSGADFGISPISSDSYWSKLIYDWIFYFSIMLVMLNIINGIIVDTFQALREQQNERHDIRDNVCYICTLNRSNFEVKGINFENHIENEHNIISYLEYIFSVKSLNEYELNSTDTETLKFILAEKTDFFPVKKAKSLQELS